MNEKIAIYCPRLTGGGAEKIAGMLSKELSQYYKDVYFFVLYKKNITYEYGGQIVDFGFDDIDNKYVGKRKWFKKFIAYLKLPMRMKNRKRELNISCTISFLDFPSIINILSKANDKIIVSIRSPKTPQKSQTHSIRNRLRVFVCHALLKLFLKRADVVVPASYGIGEDLTTNFNVSKNKVRVIYNFINIDAILNQKNKEIEEREKNFIENKFNILCVGRLEEEKNPRTLLTSFAKVAKHFSDVNLIFLGDGSLRASLIEETKILGIESKVMFVPYTNNPYKYMSRCDALIVDSLYEGYPNVIIEAMACSLPVLSVDCFSGPREIIDNMKSYKEKIQGIKCCDKGILFERGFEEEAITYAINHKNDLEKMSLNAKMFILKYSNEYIVSEWQKIIC